MKPFPLVHDMDTIDTLFNEGMNPLNEHQHRFVEEYLIDLSPTKAAVRCGLTGAWGVKQLTFGAVLDAIELAMMNRSKRTMVTQDQVLESIIKVQIDAMQKAATKHIGADGSEVIAMIDRSSALKSAELLGKHLAMFTDKVNVGGDSANPLSLAVEFINTQDEG